MRRPALLTADGGRAHHPAEGGPDLGSDWAFRPLSLWSPDKNPGTHRPLSVLRCQHCGHTPRLSGCHPAACPWREDVLPALDHTIHSVLVGARWVLVLSLSSLAGQHGPWEERIKAGAKVSPQRQPQERGAGAWALEL